MKSVYKIKGIIEFNRNFNTGDWVFIRTENNGYFQECIDDGGVAYEFTFDEDENFIKMSKVKKQ